MTSSQHVHLTCLLRFPVYRYLYPPTHENSNDFTRLQLEKAYRYKVRGSHKSNVLEDIIWVTQREKKRKKNNKTKPRDKMKACS